MTELVQRSTDFVRSALLEHLRFESNVEARLLTQQPRGQQWRVIRVSGDMLCGFLEFGEGNDRRRSKLGRHGGFPKVAGKAQVRKEDRSETGQKCHFHYTNYTVTFTVTELHRGVNRGGQ